MGSCLNILGRGKWRTGCLVGGARMWLEGTVVALLDFPAPWDPGVGGVGVHT